MNKLNNVLDILIIFNIIIISFSNNCLAGSNEIEQVKYRRGGNSGLYAFPRVGRSDPSLGSVNWDLLAQELLNEEYEDAEQKNDLKRSATSLVAFPRVGRSDTLRKLEKLAAWQQQMDKRTGASANSGLWFGPRLGRIQKRNTDEYPQN